MHASIHPSIHPSTHPSIHVTHVIMRFGLVKPFQQRDSPNALQFRSTAVYTSTTVLCPWYGERSKVSNQIDTGKEEQTSTVSCSWDRLSLGKNFDRDPIILLPAEQHGTLIAWQASCLFLLCGGLGLGIQPGFCELIAQSPLALWFWPVVGSQWFPQLQPQWTRSPR